MFRSAPYRMPLRATFTETEHGYVAACGRGTWFLMVSPRMSEKRIRCEVLRRVLTQQEATAALGMSGSDVIGIEA